jgi:hypothetical protein
MVSFFVFLVESEDDYQSVLSAIKNISDQSTFHWRFVNIDFIIQPYNNKKREQAKLFINYFNDEIDVIILSQQLKLLK